MKKSTKCFTWLLTGSMVLSGLSPALPASAAQVLPETPAQAKEADQSLLMDNGSILLANFTFDEAGEDGSLPGGNAKATGSYSLAEHAENGNAVYFDGNSQFISVTKADGSPLFTGQEEISISYDVKPNQTNAPNWDVFISNSSSAPVYNSEQYFGVLANKGITTVERYYNSGSRPSNPTGSSGSEWVHIDVEVEDDSTSLYINNNLTQKVNSTYSFSAIAGTEGIFQIGKGNWVSGEYSKGWIDNFQVYDNTLKNARESLDLGNTSAVTSDLLLPSSIGNNVAVNWSSSNPDVVDAAGKVIRSTTSNETAILTASLSKDGYTITKDFTITVIQADPALDLASAKEALQMLTVTDHDLELPANGILDTSITWKSSDPERMSDDGRILSRPAVGEGNASVTMTATLSLGGQETSKEFPIEIMEESFGYIMGYVTGDNDRNGSLHLAYSEDGRNFTALNGNAGIQFATIDTNNGTKTLSTGICYTGVYLFRKADGTFGLAAPQKSAKTSIYLYDSEDLLTYTNERLLSTGSSLSISEAACGYDTLIGAYRINWTSGEDTYSNISGDLTSLGTASSYDYTTSAEEVENLPAGAKNYNIIPVTKAEYEKILARFDVVKNTGIDQPENITVRSAADVEDALPENVTAHYDDNSQSALPVTWDIDEIDFTNAGIYTVNGTAGTYTNPLIEERADPYIIYDDENKCYYFTASYPAKGSVTAGYDRLILRKADSIQGLSDTEGGLEKEIVIWQAPASGNLSRHVWAPELHKINGTWYMFFAAGTSDNVWAIRPYILVCQGDDPYDAGNWVDENGEAEIHAATSKDRAYFQNMSLDMTYFEHDSHHYVIWADIIEQSALYMQEINPDAPWEGISDKVIMLTTPEYGWERDSERVNEGATILKHDGKIFCAFSASGTGPEYCIGMLYAEETTDLMEAASWTKMSYPLLTSADVPGEYGPGHNCFTVDAEGNPVFVYHARSEECYNNQCDWANSNSLYDPCRHARVKNVHWNKEGLPILKMSSEDECPESLSNISIQVTVEEDSDKDLNEAVITVPAEVEATGSQLTPSITVTYKGQPLTLGKDYTVSYGANTEVGIGTVTITAAEESLFVNSKTVSFSIVKPASAIVHYNMTAEEGALKNQAAESMDGTLTDVEDNDFHTYNGVSTLSLNKKGYVSLPEGMVTDNTMTVTVTAATSTLGTNQWLWTFGADSWNYMFFTPVNNNNCTKFTIGQQEPNSNTGAWGKESGIVVDSDAQTGVYHTYTVVVKDNTTSLYIDGEKVGSGANPFTLTSLLPESGPIGYIGKSLYSGDPLFIGQVADFAVYDDALTDLQVKNLTGNTDYTDYINADIYGTLLGANTAADNITGDLNLISKVDGVSLTWSVPDGQTVIEADGTVNRPIAGADAAALVQVSYDWEGETVTETFTFNVKAMDTSELDTMVENFTLPYSSEEGQEVYGNITLPSTLGKGTITWTTDHPEIVDVETHENTGAYAEDPTPAGTVTRPAEDTVVTMTASIDFGVAQKEKSFTFTVKAAPEELNESDLTDYFFAYFTGEGLENGEQVYFSSSEDGLNWNNLNNGSPYLTSELGEKGVRDPFIIRSPEGDKFYLIATDLRIYNGNGWAAAQQAGSQALMVWESNDLVNWSKQRMVTVSADIEAGCTWAPEAAYDEVTGEYVVFWASKVASDGYAKQRLYYAKTRDFYTFTEPQVMIDNSFSTIDTTIIKENDSYYRYSKNENEGAKYVFAEKTPTLLHSEVSLLDTPVLVSQIGVEGPTIFKFNEDDVDTIGYKYCLLLDNFNGGGYYPMVSNDLDGDFEKYTGTYELPGNGATPRHGTPLRITAAEYQAVMNAMATKAAVNKITIGGFNLTGFDKDVTEYTYTLDANDAFPRIAATASSSSTVTVTEPTMENPIALITVEEKGKATVTYTIRFVRTGTPIEQVTVTYLAAEGGSIEGSQVQTINKGSDAASVTAVANDGYTFIGWSDGVTIAVRTDAAVEESMTVTALFEKIPEVITYTVSYQAGEGGYIRGSSSQIVESGTSATEVTAIANGGYTFIGWSDGLTSANRTDTNITADLTVTALFEAVKVTDPEPTLPAVGNIYTVGKLKYKVTASSTANKAVAVVAPTKKNYKKITVPAAVKIAGYTYKVNTINSKAFANNKKLRTVVIGANITRIGKQSFRGCKLLKKVTIKSSKIKRIGKYAFSGISKKAAIKVPKKKFAAYRRLLKKAKLSSSVKIRK